MSFLTKVSNLKTYQKLGDNNKNNSTVTEIIRTGMLIKPNNIHDLPFLLLVSLAHRNTYIHNF